MPENGHTTSVPLSSPWILDQILLADHTHPYEVVGPSGAGKTFLLIDWALCCASSTPWLEHRASPQNVLFIRPDRKMRDVQHRAMAWKAIHPRVEGDGKGTLHLLDISDYHTTAQNVYQEAVQLVHDHAVSLIILDEWEGLGISALEMGQQLQKSLHIPLVYSLLASVDPLPRSTHRFVVHPVCEVADTGELAVRVTLPSASPLATVDWVMKRVATPGVMVDSFRESCVVFQQLETLV